MAAQQQQHLERSPATPPPPSSLRSPSPKGSPRLTDLLTPDQCSSPTSATNGWSGDGDYDTPLTSPVSRRSADRYIATATPTKEGLILRDTRKASEHGDVFAAPPRLHQYTTLRGPANPIIPHGASRVPQARLTAHREPSRGGVWTVGGTAVTEGVASATNGRGGRVTSGTSAPHYAADFLRRRRSQTEEQASHGRRLAHALDIAQTGRMVDRSSPVSPPTSPIESPSRTTWRDGKWERPLDSTPTRSSSKAEKAKSTPLIPYRVLDAPALRDDYYCSLIAYSPTLHCLAVGLGPHVYLWSENRGTSRTKLPDSLSGPHGSSHVTSLSFSSTSGGKAILAIGRTDGRITLWSPNDADPRFDSQQPSPVSHVCFRPTTPRRRSVRDPSTYVATEELLVGDEVGNVYFYSVEWPDQDQRDLWDWHGSMTLLARISCHTQQVCGMAWSPDGALFATGGNDNTLFLFETKKILRPARTGNNSAAVHVRSGSADSPGAFASTTVPGQPTQVLHITPGRERHTFRLNAACKALAFAPWQHSLLAAGGGSNDRCVHFFHALSGAKLATIDCYAQVTSLVWNPVRKEIAATFGFAQPEHAVRVAVFAWPSCALVLAVPWWGEERALYSVLYHGGGGCAESSLVVATSDASIKFHEVWSKRSSSGQKKAGTLTSQILEGELDMETESVIR